MGDCQSSRCACTNQATDAGCHLTHGQPAGKLGWLTPRGGELIAYLGHYQRQRLVADGLLAKGLPAAGQVAVIADVDERTRKTGEAFAARLAPDCAITVHTVQIRPVPIRYLIL